MQGPGLIQSFKTPAQLEKGTETLVKMLKSFNPEMAQAVSYHISLVEETHMVTDLQRVRSPTALTKGNVEVLVGLNDD